MVKVATLQADESSQKPALTCDFASCPRWDPDQSSAGCDWRRVSVCSDDCGLGGGGEPFDWLTGDFGDELVVLVDVEDDEV